MCPHRLSLRLKTRKSAFRAPRKRQNTSLDHDIAVENEVAGSALADQTRRYTSQTMCLIVQSPLTTVLKALLRAGSCLKKNIRKIRVELKFSAKVKIESSEKSKIFLSELNQYYVQLWCESGVHRIIFPGSSPAFPEYPT